MNNSNAPNAATLDNATGSENICNMWKCHYVKLLNSTCNPNSENNDVETNSDIVTGKTFQISYMMTL